MADISKIQIASGTYSIKPDVIDSSPTENSPNPVSSGGVYDALTNVFGVGSVIPDNTDVLTLTVGRWRKGSNINTLRNLPSDLSVAALMLEVINSSTSSRRMILLYPLSSSTVGTFYQTIELSGRFTDWYKFTGEIVQSVQTNDMTPISESI